MPYTVDVSGLSMSFGSTTVLDGLDLQVGAGEIVALLGPNGAGKTTTIRILSTLLAPDSGRVTVAGHDVVTERGAVRAAISLTGQYAAVDEVLTGRENLLMMGRLRHLAGADRSRRCDDLLRRFGLVDAADRRVSTYSGGMRRRLDLAMSLVVTPTVLFLDEPTIGLDPRSRSEVWEAVSGLAGSGVSVLLTTQYLDEADRLADRVVVIDRGRILANGTPASLKAQVGTETVVLGFADHPTARAAAALVARSSQPASGRDVVVDEATVRVPTDGSAAAVRALLDDLAAAGLPADRIDLHRPTLDDVFLTLTTTPDAPDTLVGAHR